MEVTVSEMVTDLDWWAATRYPKAEDDWNPAGGRHAYNEEAALTPIFHALTRSGWRRRQHEPAQVRPVADPVDQFRRDPLTAPIPVQAPAARSRRREQPDTGRHHRSRETARNYW
jgi:hypothetical protein